MRVEAHAKQTCVYCARAYCPLAREESRRDSGLIAAPDLDADEDDDDERKAEKEAPDARGVPRVGCSSPLKCKQQADDGAYEEDGAQDINLLNLL